MFDILLRSLGFGVLVFFFSILVKYLVIPWIGVLVESVKVRKKIRILTEGPYLLQENSTTVHSQTRNEPTCWFPSRAIFLTMSTSAPVNCPDCLAIRDSLRS